MNDYLYRFKKIVAQVHEETDVNFRRHGIDDLFRDAGPNPTPSRLAALAARYFCTEDDRYNGSDPGLMVVIEFINETCTKIPYTNDTDVIRTLIRMLQDGCKMEQIEAWASQFYD